MGKLAFWSGVAGAAEGIKGNIERGVEDRRTAEKTAHERWLAQLREKGAGDRQGAQIASAEGIAGAEIASREGIAEATQEGVGERAAAQRELTKSEGEANRQLRRELPGIEQEAAIEGDAQRQEKGLFGSGQKPLTMSKELGVKSEVIDQIGEDGIESVSVITYKTGAFQQKDGQLYAQGVKKADRMAQMAWQNRRIDPGRPNPNFPDGVPPGTTNLDVLRAYVARPDVSGRDKFKRIQELVDSKHAVPSGLLQDVLFLPPDLM